MMVQIQLRDRVVSAEVVKANAKTAWVRLPDGNIIKRHKAKHFIS